MCFKGYALNSLQCEFAFISSKCILVLQRYTQYHLNPPLTSELHLDGHCPKTDVIDTANQKLPENIIKNKLKKKNNISSLTFSLVQTSRISLSRSSRLAIHLLLSLPYGSFAPNGGLPLKLVIHRYT